MADVPSGVLVNTKKSDLASGEYYSCFKLSKLTSHTEGFLSALMEINNLNNVLTYSFAFTLFVHVRLVKLSCHFQ